MELCLGFRGVLFRSLMGGTVTAPTSASKIVILYPLPGRRDWEFYAILTHAEPRPQTIDPAHAVAATSAELPDTPYVAAGLKLDGRLLAIPDLEALKKAFYPQSRSTRGGQVYSFPRHFG